MKVSLPRNEEERQKMAMEKSMNDSRMMQQKISAGSDFTDRPQDEGYRPYVSPKDRATAEGSRDSGGDARVAETTGQFGDAGTSRVVKPSKSGIVTKEELEKSGMSLRDYLNKQRGLTRRKEKDPTAGEARDKAAQAAADAIDPGSDPNFSNNMNMSAYKPRRSYNEPPVGNAKRSANNYAKGGSVSSASKRADGIASKGKTRCKIC